MSQYCCYTVAMGHKTCAAAVPQVLGQHMTRTRPTCRVWQVRQEECRHHTSRPAAAQLYGLPTVCVTDCLCILLSSSDDGPAAAMQVVSFTGALGKNSIVYKGYDVEKDMQLLRRSPAVR
jgi:hypothetical protein